MKFVERGWETTKQGLVNFPGKNRHEDSPISLDQAVALGYLSIHLSVTAITIARGIHEIDRNITLAKICNWL